MVDLPVPEGAETVTVTYNKDVDIRHDGTTVYAYEVEFAATAVNRAAAQASGYTLKPITLENSYTRNADGTQTVIMPVTGYVRNADGSGKLTLTSGETLAFTAVKSMTATA